MFKHITQNNIHLILRLWINFLILLTNNFNVIFFIHLGGFFITGDNVSLDEEKKTEPIEKIEINQ